MPYFSVVAGIILIVLVLWEVFHDLFHPSGRGALTACVARAYFRVLRHRRAWLSAAGPLTLVTVILIWVAVLVVGFALIYLPGMPDGFRTSTGAIPPHTHPMFLSLYFSAEVLTTLGFGDLPPHTEVFRMVATGEALVGFALVTASVSVIVLIYPALTRTHNLALGVCHLVQAEQRADVRLSETGSDTLLAGLAGEVTKARIDLVHFPITYFFVPSSDDASLAKWTGSLERFADEACRSDRPSHVRIAGNALRVALDGLAALLAQQYLAMPTDAPADEAFEAFARYHGVERAS
jgi:hypothetical protein